jgi:hypothetical protein
MNTIIKNYEISEEAIKAGFVSDIVNYHKADAKGTIKKVVLVAPIFKDINGNPTLDKEQMFTLWSPKGKTDMDFLKGSLGDKVVEAITKARKFYKDLEEAQPVMTEAMQTMVKLGVTQLTEAFADSNIKSYKDLGVASSNIALVYNSVKSISPKDAEPFDKYFKE